LLTISANVFKGFLAMIESYNTIPKKKKDFSIFWIDRLPMCGMLACELEIK